MTHHDRIWLNITQHDRIWLNITQPTWLIESHWLNMIWSSWLSGWWGGVARRRSGVSRQTNSVTQRSSFPGQRTDKIVHTHLHAYTYKHYTAVFMMSGGDLYGLLLWPVALHWPQGPLLWPRVWPGPVSPEEKGALCHSPEEVNTWSSWSISPLPFSSIYVL